MDRDLEREREDAEEAKSRIDSAKDSLYQPGAPAIIRRHDDRAYERQGDAPTDPSQVWPPPVASVFITPEKKERVTAKLNVVFRRLLMAAVAFFVLSLGVAAFLYFYGNTVISARNINIEVTAPPSVPSSDTFSFDVSIQNGNNSDLINAALVIDYPEGARYVDDNTRALVSERIEIGTLGRGQIAKRTVSARLFGEEGAEKRITARFEYQVENSNGKFSKEEEFALVLNLAPVVLSIDALREVNNNQEVVLIARIISNSNNKLSNLALNVVYPFGFTYTRSNLEVATGARGQFPLEDLGPNETKTVEIRGMINGQSAEDKVFKFNVGTADPSNLDKVVTSLALFDHDMVIRGDFLASSITFSNNQSYGVLGVPLRGNISWRNTLNDPINDAEFTLNIKGDLINSDEVGADSGFYDSNRSLIEWNKDTDKKLEELEPGQTGNFSFTIPLGTYEEAIARRMVNPKLSLIFDIEGQRLTEDKVTENIRSSFTRIVPMLTTLKLDGYSAYSDGPLKNSGPVPSKAENKTTYTVALALSNSINEISSGELTAKLPNYVKYEGELSPSSDKVTWNESTRLLRWNVGAIPARTGYGSNPRTLYFKVSVTPSRTQINQILQLANSITFTGRDEFANTGISQTSPNVTTVLRELGNGFGNGQVVE